MLLSTIVHRISRKFSLPLIPNLIEHFRCTSCMNNSFDCSWKLLSSSCVDSDLIAHQNETIITHSLINQCPRYNVSIKEIFLADGQAFILGDKSRVRIRTSGIKSHIQKHFRCILTFINGTLIETIGKIQNNLLICQPFQVPFLSLHIVFTIFFR